MIALIREAGYAPIGTPPRTQPLPATDLLSGL
jgi:hypothetical protein